jgi:hypothetical protein
VQRMVLLVALNEIIHDVQRSSHGMVIGMSNQLYNKEFLQITLILIVNSVGQ